MTKFKWNDLSESVHIGYGHRPWWEQYALREGLTLNLYPGPVPIDVVRRVIDVPIAEEQLISPSTLDVIPGYKRIFNPLTGKTFQISSNKYVIHKPVEWCHEVIEPLLEAGRGDGLGVASVLTLGEGEYSAVCLQLPDCLTVAGMDLRPQTTVATSADGSLATQCNNNTVIVVCDNTAIMAQGSGTVAKVRHTALSEHRLEWYTQRILAHHGYMAAVAQRVEALALIPVSSTEWDSMISLFIGEEPETTKANNAWVQKRYELRSMHRSDPRCESWAGTALGALQTFSTWQQHISPMRGGNRAEKNYKEAINLTVDKQDGLFMEIIGKVVSLV